MVPHSEAILVGSELLSGAVADTNGADLARAAARVGCPLRWTTAVGDVDADLEEVIGRAVDRSPVVFVAGGLGPTVDDRTRFAIARVAGVDLQLQPPVVEDIRAFFRRFDREMPASNAVQAQFPVGSEVIPNPVGTAPGFALEIGKAYLLALPGVPRELRHLLEMWVLPRLQARPDAGAVVSRTLKLSGLGESSVGEAVADLMATDGNPYLGILAAPGEVHLVLTARGRDLAAARQRIAPLEDQLRARLGKAIFGTDGETHAGVALGLLRAAGQTLASVETFTGGELASCLWQAANPAYRGGRLVPGTAVAEYSGATEGPAAAVAAARRVAREHGSTVGVAVLLQSEVGTRTDTDRAWVGAWAPGVERARPLPLGPGTDANRLRACNQACYELRQAAIAVRG